MAMLCFDIRSLESRAEAVDGVLEATDPVWESDDLRPIATGENAGVHVEGRLSAAGQGRFYFSGALQGMVTSPCRRCLTDVVSPVEEEMHVLFAESGMDEAEEDDVFLIPANVRELDLRPAVREEWLLAVPHFALCREDCQGLCPNCGADRNAGPHDCTHAS